MSFWECHSVRHTVFRSVLLVLTTLIVRNVYALFNYGDFIAGSSASRGDPYIQLLGTTNPAQGTIVALRSCVH